MTIEITTTQEIRFQGKYCNEDYNNCKWFKQIDYGFMRAEECRLFGDLRIKKRNYRVLRHPNCLEATKKLEGKK